MPKMIYVPIAVATVPLTGHAWVDHWWMCDAEKGLMWWTSELTMFDVKPQCNPDKAVIDQMIKRSDNTECVAVQVPVVYEAHAVRELRSQRDQKRMFSILSKDWNT